MPPQGEERPAILQAHVIVLFGAMFFALLGIFPLAGSTWTWRWNPDAGFLVALVFASASAVMLLYRSMIVPLMSRFFMSTALWVYVLAIILLKLGMFFLADTAELSAAAMQSWLLFVPRFLLAGILLLSAFADRGEQEGEGSGRWVWVGSVLLVASFLSLEFLLPIPETFSYGAMGRVQELLPLLLFLAAFVRVLHRGAWLEDRFVYGMLWMLLTQIIASVYFLFSRAAGSTIEITGFLIHVIGLALPLLTVQAEMFRLYKASEEYRSEQAHVARRFGARRKELTTALFRQAVEQSHDPLYITDAQGRVVFVNRGFTTMTGYLPRDVIGETPEYWSHASGGTFVPLFSQARVRKEPVFVTLQQKRKDGTIFEATVHISPIVNELGEVTWFVVGEQDLSEVKDRTLLLQQILDNMPLGICLLEIPSTKVLLSNHYAEELFQRMGLKQVGEFRDLCSVMRLSGGKPCPEEKLPLAETLRTSEMAERDDMEIWPAGATSHAMIWKLHATPLFDAKAELRHILLSFDDVTHQKELEHKMTDSISVVSHQLRTPLTGIKWALDEYRRSERSAMAEEDRAMLFETLHQATVRMFDVIQGLLDTSKIEQGRIELKPESVQLDAFIAKTIEDFSPMIREKKLTVKQSVLHSLPEASYDLILLRQVVQNLIDNAVKYTPAGGEIDSILSLEKNRVHWTLHDTGIGITREDLAHLFEKFHRGDNAQKLDAYGMGLGLFAVKSIMDLFKGEIRCESEEGKGTTFHLFFPLTPSPRTA